MSKLITLKKAISEFVNDGDIVYAAGFTHLIPFAAGHEIIRQGKKNLTLARATPDLIYDQMVAAGCAKMRTSNDRQLTHSSNKLSAGNILIQQFTLERKLHFNFHTLKADAIAH